MNRETMVGSLVRAAFCLTALASVASSFAADPVLLRYKFRPNQFLRYEVQNNVEIVSQFAEEKDRATNESTSTKLYRVVSIDEDSVATVEPIVEKVRIRAQVGAAPATMYDSERDPAPESGPPGIEQAIGRPTVRMRLAANGELKGVARIQSDSTTAGKGATAADAPDPRMNFLIRLPDRPVAVGDRWKDSLETQIPVKNSETLQQTVTLQRVYELTSFDGAVAVITFQTASLKPINDPQIEGKLCQLLPTGRVVFDVAQGTIRSQEQAVDHSVVGAMGPRTQLIVKSRLTETLEAGAPSVINASQAKPLPK